MESLIQILTDWGYAGLFLSALLAGSIVPFSSELVMAALVAMGLKPWLCVLSASLGNTLGGLTCYWLGRLGRTDWIEKYLGVKPEKVEKMQRFLSARARRVDGLFYLPAFCGRGHRGSPGLHAQQPGVDLLVHVCG